MTTIGIDMSKDSFHAAFPDGRVVKYENTDDGMAAFDDDIPADSVCGVEATGIYHEPLCAYLYRRGYPVRVINPMLTAKIAESELRMVKHDRKDARIVREAVLAGKGYPYLDTPEITTLKALVAERSALITMRGDLKRRRHVHDIREKAAGLPLHDSYERIHEALNAEIMELDARMGEYARETQQLLRSIPGIGKTAAAQLIASIGDIGRFSSPKQLVAYIGVDPRVKESGVSVKGSGAITKRGSSKLRTLLFQSAFIAYQRDPAFARFYRKKKNGGKHHHAILCALERKLIHRIFAVWTRGTPFEPEK